MIKRILDVVVSAIMLVALLPLLIPVVILLKLTGEKQAFYVQPRVGRDGRNFGLIKFVTMVANSEQIGSKDVTLKNDPRVLPVGKFLRKTKINELPQLINVLKGDMSVVGWRPLLRAGFERYPIAVQKKLIEIKPGLTGIGSIVFRDEEQVLDSSEKPFEECYRDDIMPYKGALESWYIDNQSLWLDIKVILATAFAVVFPSTQSYARFFRGLPSPSGTTEVSRFRSSVVEPSV